MDRKTILLQIQDIFRKILDNQVITINEETTANDVEGWDSLSHIQLIVAIEKYFGIKFSSKEIILSKSIGDLLDVISQKLA